MTGITWLHLSDWHEGRPAEAVFDRTVVLRELLNDIRNREKISRDLAKVDFIVFSGDVAFSGSKEQYKDVEEFFDQVLEATGLKDRKDRLFIVPGNHDLEDSRVEGISDVYDEIRKPLNTESAQLSTWIDKYLTESGNLDLLLNPFASYRDFVSKYTGQKETDRKLTYASFKQLNLNPEVNVALVGLNSALMARRKNEQGKVQDFGKLIVGEPQVDICLQDIEGHHVKIAVMHHPFSWLCQDDQNKIRFLLSSHFDFVLCGHRHKYEASQVVVKQGDCYVVAAGATYESREHLNSYNFVHFDPKTRKGRVYLRRWDNDVRQWVKAPFLRGDRVVYTGCYEFPPPPSPKPLPPPTLIGEETWTKEERETELKNHYAALAKAITEGTVVPILGADINLCGRPQTQVSNPWEWKLDDKAYPPTNLELAAYIESQFLKFATIECPFGEPCTPDDPNWSLRFPRGCPLNTKQITWIDLPHISEFFSSRSRQQDEAGLRNAINNIYDHGYEPNVLYEFLATSLIEECTCQEIELLKGMSPRPLIVTTCFDRTLEIAFEKHKQPYDLLSYSTKDMCFSYQKYDFVDNEKKQFRKSNLMDLEKAKKEDEDAFSLKSRPVILRLYGPVFKVDGEHFAITEDHFLKYLIHAEQTMFPEILDHLLTKLRNSYLWFLGYNLSYWHLRIILHKIAKEIPSSRPTDWAWAIQEKPQHLERELWESNKVKLFSHLSIPSLEKYIEQVSQKLNPQGTTSNPVY